MADNSTLTLVLDSVDKRCSPECSGSPFNRMLAISTLGGMLVQEA